MATLHLTGATTVADLRKQFNAAFGSQVKIYNGGRLAEPTATLAELGLKADADFSCYANLTVGSFIERMKENHGLKVKVYTCDEWVAVLDGLTLEASGKVKNNATKADMESLIAYQRTEASNEDEELEEDIDDEEFEDDDEGFCDNVEYKGIEYSCYDGTAEASMFIDDELEEAESIIIPQTITDPETGNKFTVNGYTISEGAYTKISFPVTLEYIQGETFSEMDKDVLLKLKHNLDENKNFIIKDRWIYQYEDFENDKHVYQLKNVQLNRPQGKCTIPEGVEAIARSLFANCDELEEVTLPSSIRHIDNEPFDGCDALKRIVIYAPKDQIKCYDDCGEEISKIESIVPKGVELVFASKPKEIQPKEQVKEKPIVSPSIADDMTAKVELYLDLHSDVFPADKISAIKKVLLQLDEAQITKLNSLEYKKPTTTFLLALVLGLYGVDRFYLEDWIVGVAKFFTAGGFFILWIIDIATAFKRTKEYNYKLLNKHL